MKKTDLKTGMMVEMRNGDKYIVVNNKLACVIDGHMDLDDYDNELFIALALTLDDYKNDDYDIMEVYNIDEFGNYKCIWDREKDVINNREYIIDMKDNEGYTWGITVSPNNPRYGYSKSQTATPFCISNNDTENILDNIYLTSDGAKQLISALQEILDYLDSKNE